MCTANNDVFEFRNENGGVTVVVPDWVLDVMDLSNEIGDPKGSETIWNFFLERHPYMTCLMPYSRYMDSRH